MCITNLAVNTSASQTFPSPYWQCAERRAAVAAEAAVGSDRREGERRLAVGPSTRADSKNVLSVDLCIPLCRLETSEFGQSAFLGCFLVVFHWLLAPFRSLVYYYVTLILLYT